MSHTVKSTNKSRRLGPVLFPVFVFVLFLVKKNWRYKIIRCTTTLFYFIFIIEFRKDPNWQHS